MKEQLIEEDIEVYQKHAADDSESLVTLYGHVNTVEKWWVLSRRKSIFLKNTRLLYIFGAVPTSKPEYIQNPDEPSVADIGNDIDGYMYELKEKKWA